MLYFDNAATSFPKAPDVGERMKYYIEEVGASVNRGVYGAAQTAELQVLLLREQLCALFSHPEPTRVLLTSGATAALNLGIKGFVRAGDHVLVSAMEHNAVMRQLVQLGVDFDRVPCAADGTLRLDKIEGLLRPNTRLFVLCHASNVCGTVQDAAAVGRLCKLHSIPLLLDAAQSAGHIPVDFESFHLSALAIPAHKGLLGPQGIGALLVTEDFAAQLDPLISGGTGSMSDSETLPPYLPDRFESGTPNLPGVYGWSASLDYVNQVGISALREHERLLTARFLRCLQGISGVTLIGKPDTTDRVGVLALDFPAQDNAEVSDRLAREYGILTRCGLHCAPSAHRALGTFPRGVVRFSLGHRTTEAEIDAALEAVAQLADG